VNKIGGVDSAFGPASADPANATPPSGLITESERLSATV
jgi:hypothetical protein